MKKIKNLPRVKTFVFRAVRASCHSNKMPLSFFFLGKRTSKALRWAMSPQQMLDDRCPLAFFLLAGPLDRNPIARLAV